MQFFASLAKAGLKRLKCEINKELSLKYSFVITLKNLCSDEKNKNTEKNRTCS